MRSDVATGHITRLISAAGADDHAVTRLLDELGPAVAAPLLVDELVFRCEPPRNEYEVFVQVDIVYRTSRRSHTLSIVAGKPVTAREGVSASSGMRLEFQAPELVSMLYGVPRERSAGLYRSELRPESWEALSDSYGISAFELMGATRLAVESLVGGLSHRRPSLNELATRYGSDKWSIIHWFTPHYDRHLRDLREQQVRVLEIGIGGYADPCSGGESLKMWKRYFPRGLVYGMDIVAKEGLDEPRLATLRGDQSDRAFLESVAGQSGPFDVVIDDGSHVNEHILASFDALFPHVRPGGFYVIEDLWTAYCPGFGGDDEDLGSGRTSLGLLKGLVDRIHHEERDTGETGYLDHHIVGLHVYHNIAFIQKGVNAEGGIPSWIPRSSAEINPVVTE